MPQLLWDASGLAKRYYDEAGSDTVDAIFAQTSVAHMQVAVIGYAEVAAILRRKYNSGFLTSGEFQQARNYLQNEVLFGSRFVLTTVEDIDILNGISLTDHHNINSTDASILAAYLRFSRAQSGGSATCLLVASDQRLIRAAAAEGLSSLNPKTVPAAAIPALLR